MSPAYGGSFCATAVLQFLFRRRRASGGRLAPPGVSLERVERAIYLGVARKYIALINNGQGTPITTLRYFEHLIDEVIRRTSRPTTGGM